MTDKTLIKFGTDGWRAVIAEEFTFANVRRCAQATAGYMKSARLADAGVVIGWDTRFSSSDFASATARTMADTGIKVWLSRQAVPTPVISYTVASLKAGGGIAITASHNPANWNGFKFKSPDGASAPAAIVEEIEERIAAADLELLAAPAHEIEKASVTTSDFTLAYLEHIGKLLDIGVIRSAGLKVAVDSMHGAGCGWFKSILSGAKTTVHEIRGEPNPAFPGMKQPEPIAVNLSGLSDVIRQTATSVGLALDGDADRLGIMDEHGNFLTQLQVYALLALYFLEVRGERGAIVKTITTTNMLNRLGTLFNVPVFEVPVGFKYVAPVMLRENALIGGEESGGYGFRGHVPERDGILAGLYFLDFMARTGRTPSQLLARLYDLVGPHYYDRRDVTFDKAQRSSILERMREVSPEEIAGFKVEKKEDNDGFRFLLKGGSWLLVRFSGTEPLLRIYAEGDSIDNVNRILEAGAALAGVTELL
ncbi:MAG: phosphoglucomutase/phosphomannomutase family protein [Dehalococcoidia bacterium]|nr:phosphoglucomutase/phosphomannomutase family protein [Dehalococcoidia bacterium]